ncbi:MAG TPA: peptidase U32 family protein [Candidatus Nanoarchaeia archaeon]|nr:peptidase U32 family protein [Candidatus Nanoarchaeia archaeon]
MTLNNSSLNENTNELEIMSPAGNFECLASAIKAGANSVYFGVEQLNMRARAANNFTLADLGEIVKTCKEKNVKTYLTLNTIMYDHDIILMKKICDAAKKEGVSAVIASDISAISYANSIGLEVHISTQQNVSNMEAVRFYAKFADVIVLARELTLSQVKKICDDIKKENIKGPNGELVRIELFAHGALCVAVSGKCYMSLGTYNASANRGACLQNCRRSYKVTDNETGDELVIDNEYVMSPSDLCTIGFIDKLIDAGVKVFKLEGRGRSADYVYTVTKCYRDAADSVLEGNYTEEKIKGWTKKLESVYNRGFWHGGYYLGKKLGEWSGTYGSKATKEKVFVGIAKHYFPKTGIGEFHIQSEMIKTGDEILITGNTTGVIEGKVESMFVNDKPNIEIAKQGDVITFKVSERVRENDKLYVVKNKEKFQGQNNKLKVVG